MAQLEDTQQKQVDDLILAGRKIEAIKVYREAVPQSDLTQAKSAVDERERELKKNNPQPVGASPKKSGCLSLLAGVIMLVVVGLIIVNLGR